MPRGLRREFKPVVEAARDEAARWGGYLVSCGYKKGRGHPYVVVGYRGGRRKMSLSQTPRTGQSNQVDWVRQGVRRLVKKMGAT